MTTEVIFEQKDQIGWVTFQSENGIQILSRATRESLGRILDQVLASGNNGQAPCRVLVIRARGKTFLAGADIRELLDLDEASAYEYAREGQRLFEQISRLPMVTVVALQATCVGGGCELALACDFRLCSSSALIGLPEVGLGLIPGWGGLVRARRLLGESAARRIVLSGELLSAEQAHRIGLVDEIYPEKEFETRVTQRVALLAGRAPKAITRAKALLRELGPGEIDRELEREAREFAACYRTREPHEGITSFLEKRGPRFENP